MSERFFVESPIENSSNAELEGDEARHLAKVMRAQLGEEVVLFDGCGSEYLARITKIAKANMTFEILERRALNRESNRVLTLAVALPKGDRQRFLIEKLVELGVSRLIPLETRRGVAEAGPAVLERLRRQVIEASKQCGRNRLMEISTPLDMIVLARTIPVDVQRLLAHPIGHEWQSEDFTLRDEIVAAVGPEGGFTDEECSLAQSAGWETISLGPRILRVETAALCLASRCL